MVIPIHLPSKTAAVLRISHTTQKLQKVVQLGIQRGQEGRALGKTFVPEALCLGICMEVVENQSVTEVRLIGRTYRVT